MGATRRTRPIFRAIGIGAIIVAVCAISSCGRSEAQQREMYRITKSYVFTIVPSEAPPHARDDIMYKVFIRDRDTRGQIYSSDSTGRKTWDGLTYGPEVGTYRGKLSFITSGLWAIAIRFRRDSLHPLETLDWMQEVLNERPSTTP